MAVRRNMIECIREALATVLIIEVACAVGYIRKESSKLFIVGRISSSFKQLPQYCRGYKVACMPAFTVVEVLIVLHLATDRLITAFAFCTFLRFSDKEKACRADAVEGRNVI